MADGITLDKVNVEIESNSSKASKGIDALTDSIKKLQGASSNSISSLNNLNNTIKNITNNLNTGFDNISTKGLDNVQKGVTDINKTKISPNIDISELDDVKEDIIDIKKSDITPNIDTSSLKEYGKKISQTTLDGENLSTTFKKVENGITKITTQSKKGTVVIEKYTEKQDKLINVLKAFKGLGIASIFKSIYSSISGYINESSSYISNMNNFNTTMGEMKDKATSFVNTMSKDFYLDSSDLTNYMSNFNSLIKGFGIGSEAAYTMSKNLTQLSYDLSAFKGISIENAMQKLKSGISGKIICLVRKGLRIVTYLIAGKSKQERCR